MPCVLISSIRAGDRKAAVDLYRSAASKTTSTRERDYLLMKAADGSDPARARRG